MYPSEKAPFILCKGYEIAHVGSVIAAPPGYREPAASTFGAPAQPSTFGAPAQLGLPPAALTSESNPNFVFKGNETGLTHNTAINVLKPPVKSTLASVGKSRKSGNSGVVKLGSQKLAGEKKDPKEVASKPLAQQTPAPLVAVTPQALAFGAQPPTSAAPFAAPPPPTSAASTPFGSQPSAASPFAPSPSTASPFAAATEAQPPKPGTNAVLKTDINVKRNGEMDELKKNIRKRSEPEKQIFAQELRGDENIQREDIQGSKKQKKELEGGSPTISIPTPSKTRKSHQRKRSNSSNKSTFKRRKYTEE
jgi:hypothetical protein